MGESSKTCKKRFGSYGDRLRTVKPLKYEHQIPKFDTRLDKELVEIDKKYNSVRDPYLFLFPLSKPSTISVNSLLSDNIKVKISPPESVRQTKTPNFHSNIDKSNENSPIIEDVAKNNDQSKTDQKECKLHFVTPVTTQTSLFHGNNEESNEPKIFTKESCPRHTINLTTDKSDNDISQSSPKGKERLKHIFNIYKDICKEHKPYVDKSQSSIYSGNGQKSTENKTFKKYISKASILGEATLLPRFDKTISIDSSVVAQGYFDAKAKPPRSESQSDIDPRIGEVKKADFLPIPNLRFVSSRPSFSKLSLADSVEKGFNRPENMPIISNEKFLAKSESPTTNNKKLTFDPELVDKLKNFSKTMKLNKLKIPIDAEYTKEKMAYYEKKFMQKAIDRVKKKRYSKNYTQNYTQNCTQNYTRNRKTALSSGDSETSTITNYKTNFVEVQNSKKWNEIITKYLKKSKKIKSTALRGDKTKSINIPTLSRSISEMSANLINNTTIPSTTSFKEIPKARLFQRPQNDKCLACLYKPFDHPTETTSKVKHDFQTISNINSSSVSSDSIIETIKKYSNYNQYNESIVESLNLDGSLLEAILDYKRKDTANGKDLGATLMDKKNIIPTAKSGFERLSPIDKTILPQAISNQYSKEKSSIQSPIRSKASTLSNQSSDSEVTRIQEDNLPTFKFRAPCHAPVVLRKSLEPLRALKLQKTAASREKEAALAGESSKDSDSDSYNIVPSKLPATKQEESAPLQVEKDAQKMRKKKGKAHKGLVRMKSALDNLTTFASSIDLEEIKKKKLLKRAKTTFDLIYDSDESKCESSDEEDVDLEDEGVPEHVDENKDLPYSEIITKHRASSPPSPIMSVEEINNIITECLKNDFNAHKLVEKLSEEFANKLVDKYNDTEDIESKEKIRIGLNLFKTLIDSMRYLKPDTFDSNLEFSFKQTPKLNAHKLSRILTKKTYELVAPIVGIKKLYIPKSVLREKDKLRFFDVDSSIHKDDDSSLITLSNSNVDLIVHWGTDNTSSINVQEKKPDVNQNPYLRFLKRPRRKAITWRPLRKEDLLEYDPEATLKMRAARLTNRICTEFCDWLNQLGGAVQKIDVETLEDMFEINFSSIACVSTQMTLKEMPTIPTAVVLARKCSDADELMNTRKQIREDLKVEKRSKRTFAFGQTLPRELRFVPPTTRIRSKWLYCENIPKDVESMDVVWDGIMHLDSVRSFMTFLQTSSQVQSQKLYKNLSQRCNEKTRKGRRN